MPLRQISCKDWTLDVLLAHSNNFEAVPRISYTELQPQTPLQFERDGKPLIIEGWHLHPEWPADMFSIDYYEKQSSSEISARNACDGKDKMLTSVSDLLAKQRSCPAFTSPQETERLYGKDLHCPAPWTEWLNESGIIPTSLAPNNEDNPLVNLPHPVETLMCYLGVGDTATPAHKDLCASSGHNLMCATENGSSFWFMTETSETAKATAYFQKLRQELDHEAHFITLEELANAPFKVYVCEQKLGDLVLVPPRSMHEVVNAGPGLTLKMSWSRMTIEGLVSAFHYELPIYQRVCRIETYRVKSTVVYTLLKHITKLEANLATSADDMDVDDVLLDNVTSNSILVQDAKRLLALLDAIIQQEAEPQGQTIISPPEDMKDIDGITCDFCGADIFRAFFECRACVNNSDAEIQFGSGYVVCTACYVDGRICSCTQNMSPCIIFPFQNLLDQRRNAVRVLNLCPGPLDVPSEEDVLAKAARYGTFMAACAIHTNRISKVRASRTRACRLKVGDPSHEVPTEYAVQCKPCHSAKCYHHLLETAFIHSTEAILIVMDDATHSKWHDRHKAGTTRVKKWISWPILATSGEGREDPLDQKSGNAMLFKICRPINAQFSQLGWYDELDP